VRPDTPAKLILFWDYDTQWGADCSRCGNGSGRWGILDFEYTETLLDLHARYDLPACFAVVGAAALPGMRPYHDPGQIRRIHAAGHEIASHAFRHEWLPRLDGTALTETLRRSKDALEQCIGAPVRSFVPPYNQPFDYPAGWSFSLSERREAGPDRTDLGRVCECLRDTGYRFCRVSFRSLALRLLDRVLGRRIVRAGRPVSIRGIRCLRLNTQCGFDAAAQRVLKHCVNAGGYVLAYGHPHSIYSGNSQDIRHLRVFLDLADRYRRERRLEIELPTRPCQSVALASA